MTDENILTKMRIDGVDYDIVDQYSGAAKWGKITGTLADQTDLNTELDGKVAKNQGTAEAGKMLVVGTDGNVTTETKPTSAEWGNITGDITVQADLGDALDAKLGTTYPVTEAGKYLKVDTDGSVKPIAGSGTTTEWGDITGTITEQTDLITKMSEYVPKQYGTEAAGKVLGVDSTGAVTAVQGGTSSWGNITGTLSNQADLNTELEDIREDITAKLDSNAGTTQAGKYMKVRDDGEIVPTDLVISGATWGGIGGTLSNQTDLNTALTGKLDSDYPTTQTGYVLEVNSVGKAVPTSKSMPFANVSGQPTDNTNLATALNGKLNTTDISDTTTATDKLWSSSKINNLITGLSGVAKIEVVATLPTAPVNNTMYYVGTQSPYAIYLRANDKTYDMGSTSVDLSNYVPKSDIVDNLTTTATNKPLSANMGKSLDETHLKLTGGTMTGAIAMSNQKITGLGTPSENTDCATKAYVDTIGNNKLPLAGGTMTGAITMPVDIEDIKGKANTGSLTLCGGTTASNGANVKINGKDNTDGKGFITLTAQDANNAKKFILKPDGGATWNGNQLVTVAGASIWGTITQSGAHNQTGVMTVTNNSIKIGTNKKGVCTTSKDRILEFDGGTSSSEGSFMTLSGSANTDGTYGKGNFVLSSNNGTKSKVLSGSADTGKLTWGGQSIVCGEALGDELGNVIIMSPIRVTPKTGITLKNTDQGGKLWLKRGSKYLEVAWCPWDGIVEVRRIGFTTAQLSVTMDLTAKTLKVSGTYEGNCTGIYTHVRQVKDT